LSTARRSCEWLAPGSWEEALALKAERGDETTVVAGGTFLGILVNQRLLEPSSMLSLSRVPGLDRIEADDELRLGAMVRHRSVERSALVSEGWRAVARAFSLVASPRVRNQATVGGVLADADYASDPPAVLCAHRARVVVSSSRSQRRIAVEELVTGYYETSLAPDELVAGVEVPQADRAVYRKFRSRSHEDRPCVSVAAAARDGEVRVVVGAVAGTLQYVPEACALASGRALDGAVAAEVGRRYAEAIEPISDVRGSAAYRKRVIAVEVRRALEQLEAAE
jgi:carbon-monoxide dehydrogenase medium subunit